MLRRLIAPSLLVSLLFAAGPADATLLRPFDLAGLSGAADVVVRGRVVAQEARRDADSGRIYTYSEIEVLEVVKGDVPAPATDAAARARVTVKQIGGAVGDRAMTVAGTADLAPTEEVVLFLRTDGRFHYLVGMHQGKYGVRRDESGAWVTREPLPKPPAAPAAPAAEDGRTLRTAPTAPAELLQSRRAARTALGDFLESVRRHVRAAAAPGADGDPAGPTSPSPGATVAP